MAIEVQGMKIATVIRPVAILDDASWTTIEIDTLGWEHALVVFDYAFSDIAMAAFAVTESDTAGSGHANVTGLIFGTSNNTSGAASTLPSATDDGLIFACEIDLKARKRYLDLTLTAGNGATGTFAVAWCVLSRGKALPITAAERGCSQILRVG